MLLDWFTHGLLWMIFGIPVGEIGDIEELNRSARNVILRKEKNITIAEKQIKNELHMMLQN